MQAEDFRKILTKTLASYFGLSLAEELSRSSTVALSIVRTMDEAEQFLYAGLQLLNQPHHRPERTYSEAYLRQVTLEIRQALEQNQVDFPIHWY